jgi:signal transduction histidine kinase
MDNALKYRDPKRSPVINVSGAIEHGRAVYCVRDNGIGIAAAHQDKIFELFHRLDPSRSRGDGLGLTIVRQILGRMEGEIRVESEPGTGSRFYVTLPHGTVKAK